MRSGELVDRQPRPQVLGDPDLQLADRGHLGRLRGERDAQLRLTTRPPQEQHQLACRFVGEAGAAVLLHPGQREIDARGEAGRRVDVPVLDPERLVLDAHRWDAAPPARGRTSSARWPAARSAGRPPPAGRRRRTPRRAAAPRPAIRLSQADSAASRTDRLPSPQTSEHGVARALHALEVMPRDEGQHAALALDGPSLRAGDDLDRVERPARQAIGRVEHLEGPDQVELVDRRHHHDDDPAARWAARPRLTGAMPPTIARRVSQAERARWRIPADLWRESACAAFARIPA